LSAEESVCILNGVCGEKRVLGNALLEPDEWRNSMHRLLRDDIFGHGMMTPGLKGIISEMEQRQRRGHTNMNVLTHTGLYNGFEQRQCVGERNAPCLQILGITKTAMESLVIA
jgi:hypothetical protein